MGLRSQDIVSLLNGVSEQAASQRHPTQGEHQVNLLSSIAEGLERRPPTQNVAHLMAAPTDEPFVHKYARDASEKYSVVIADGALKVFDLVTGTEKTVTSPDGTAYLASTVDAREAFSAVTFGDFTFIANNEFTPAMDAATVSGTLTGTVQTFSDLPASPATNSVYKIIGDENNDFDTYFVKFDGTVYTEAIEPGIAYTYDMSTMPHVLISNGDGTFNFEEGEWGDRTVGDVESSPDPTFVGSKIYDVFFFRNRLGFLAGESVILSRSGTAPGGYFQFWPQSVQSSLDTDPIDLDVPHNKVSSLRYAVPFAKRLVLFSGRTQFSLGTDTTTLTPSTAYITPSTEFEALSEMAPVSVGTDLYFGVDNGNYATMREYYVERNTSAEDALDVSAHVPTFIPSGGHHLSASANRSLVCMLTTGAATRIYIYKFFWRNEEKVQASWSYWEFEPGAQVWSTFFEGSRLYLTIERSDGLYLEHMDFNSDPTIAELGVTVHLDRRSSLTGSYSAGTGLTTWTLPYPTSETVSVILGGGFQTTKGTLLSTSQPTTTTVTAAGDYSAHACYVGLAYESRYRFSEQFVRRTSRDGVSSALLGGRLQLRHFTVRFRKTGYFRSEVSGTDRNLSTKVFSRPRPATTATTFDDSAVLHTGETSFTVGGRSSDVSIDLINDSWLPSTFLSAQWSGVFNQKRVSH